MLTKIKKIFSDGCIIFTVFAFALTIAHYLLSGPAITNSSGLSLHSMLLLLACSLLFRLYYDILSIEKIKFALRVVLNYLLVMSTAVITVMINNNLTGNQTGVLFVIVFIALLSIIYSAAMVITAIAKRKIEVKAREKEEYKPIVKKK